MELGNIVREFLEYDERGRTEFAETFAQERLGKGKRTLYRYTKAYQEASAWADKMHKQDGGNYDFFKVLCLCRKPKEAGTFPSFTPEVKQVIKNIWFNKEFAQNQGTREMLYEKLQAIANINHWEKIPSYQSVARYISHLMNDEGMRNAWYLASRGEREYKNKVMVKCERNTKDLKVMQVVMGDEHTFDCWVAYTHPNGKVTAIKPHLVAWVDIKSRRIIGDVMCKDANSDILKQSLLKLLYKDAGSVPQYIYIDNGKDYTARNMTGYARNDRQRMEFDDTTKDFTNRLVLKIITGRFHIMHGQKDRLRDFLELYVISSQNGFQVTQEHSQVQRHLQRLIRILKECWNVGNFSRWKSFLKNGLNGCMKYMKSKRMEHLRSRENNSRHRRAASKILRNISKHVRRRAMQLF